MSVAVPAARVTRQRFDVLRVPVLGAFLRWRYARFVLQVPLLLIALIALYDGFTGRQVAPANTATVSVWVHYRGLVALAIAIVGNLFCAACPLMLTRGPSKWLKTGLERVNLRFEWPRALRNKYTVLALTVLFLFCYEHFDLWASPWLTAWLILGYFAAALLIDSFFPAGTFCKYVCPLGNFNFALSNASPTQITARDVNVCTSCEGKYCLNGREETPTERKPLWGKRADHVLVELPMVSGVPASSVGSGLPASSPAGAASSSGKLSSQMISEVVRSKSADALETSLKAVTSRTFGTYPGCETELFVPAIHSNTDCTLCLNCLRACPYDNVALTVRAPTVEASDARPRADWALFVTVLAWAGLVNAFAMIGPFFALATWLSGVLGTRDEAIILLIIQVVGLGVGLGLSLLAARASGLLSSNAFGRLRDWGMTLVPLALAVWAGHYLYHFLTGYATLWPNINNALYRMGFELPSPGTPSIPRLDQAFIWQVVLSYLGLGATVWAAYRRAARARSIRAMIPQVILAVVFVTLTLLIFSQPMQARGSILQ